MTTAKKTNKPLITRVISDSSREVRDEAATALPNYPSDAVFDLLMEGIQKSSSPDLETAKWVIVNIAKDRLEKIKESMFSNDTAKRSATESIYRNINPVQLRYPNKKIPTFLLVN